MSVSVTWEWDPVMGPKLAAYKLAALEISIRAGGFRQPLQRSIREVIIPELEHQFDVGGDPRWAPLHAVTIEKKQRLGRDNGILQETMKLRKAVTAQERWRVRNDEAIFTGLPGYAYYGMYHLSGTVNMVQRDWARWSNDTISRVATVFDDWLDDKIKAVF